MYTIQSPVFQSSVSFPSLSLSTLHSLAGTCLLLHHHDYPDYLDPAHDVPSLYYQAFTADYQLHSAYLIHLPHSDQYLTLLNDLLSSQLAFKDDDQWETDIALMIYRLEYCLTPADAKHFLPQALILLLSYAQQIGQPYENIGQSDTRWDLIEAHDRFQQLPFQEVLVEDLISQLFDFGVHCFEWTPEEILLETLDRVVQSLLSQPRHTSVTEG